MKIRTTREKKIAKRIRKGLIHSNPVDVNIMDYGKKIIVTVEDIDDDTFEDVALTVKEVMDSINMPKYSLVGEYK